MVVVFGGAFLVQTLNWHARYTVWVYGLGLPHGRIAHGGLRPLPNLG